MIVIRTSCENCGPIHVPLDEVVLEVDRFQGLSTYTARCRLCGDETMRFADDRTRRELVLAGARVVELDPACDPLTYDDLLDLHLLLGSEGWFERLSAGIPIAPGEFGY